MEYFLENAQAKTIQKYQKINKQLSDENKQLSISLDEHAGALEKLIEIEKINELLKAKLAGVLEELRIVNEKLRIAEEKK